jgi:beta-N-acetylhexosaminidase
MTSNVVYREIDEKPFSFSEKGIQLLRSRVKGDYLIISDDLAQNSLLNEYSLEEIVSLPIEAGADILIFSGWRKPVRQGISAFKQGDISEQRINQSVLKIIKLKQNL